MAGPSSEEKKPAEKMPEKPAEERRLIIDNRWVLADAGVFRYLGALSWTAELLASAYEGSEEKALALTLRGSARPSCVSGPATRITLQEERDEQGRTGIGLQALPHCALSVGVPVLVSWDALSFVRDMHDPDRVVVRDMVKAAEKSRAVLRVARARAAA